MWRFFCPARGIPALLIIRPCPPFNLGRYVTQSKRCSAVDKADASRARALKALACPRRRRVRQHQTTFAFKASPASPSFSEPKIRPDTSETSKGLGNAFASRVLQRVGNAAATNRFFLMQQRIPTIARLFESPRGARHLTSDEMRDDLPSPQRRCRGTSHKLFRLRSRFPPPSLDHRLIRQLLPTKKPARLRVWAVTV